MDFAGLPAFVRRRSAAVRLRPTALFPRLAELPHADRVHRSVVLRRSNFPPTVAGEGIVVMDLSGRLSKYTPNNYDPAE